VAAVARRSDRDNPAQVRRRQLLHARRARSARSCRGDGAPPGCARRAQGDLGPNLTLLAGYREPPNFEVSPTTRGISSSILDAGEGAIRISDRKISALADRLPIFEKPHQQVT
jgi:hypothetical protein